MKIKLMIAGLLLTLGTTAAMAAGDQAGKTRAACSRLFLNAFYQNSVGLGAYVTSAARVCAGADFARESAKLSSRLSRYNEKVNAALHKLDSKAPGCDASLAITTSSTGPFDVTVTVAQASAFIHAITSLCAGP